MHFVEKINIIELITNMFTTFYYESNKIFFKN